MLVRSQRRHHRAVAQGAEKDLLADRRGAARVTDGQQGGHASSVAAQDRDVAGDDDGDRFRIVHMAREKAAVTLGAMAEQRIPRKTQSFEHAGPYAVANSAAARSTNAAAACAG